MTRLSDEDLARISAAGDLRGMPEKWKRDAVFLMLAEVKAQREEIARMRSALRTIDEDFDHEEQTREHGPRNADGMPRYGGICRCCEAHRALTGEEWNP